MSEKERLEMFKLEDRVLFDAAGAAEVVDAADAANQQPDPNAQQSAAEQQAQDDRNAVKNAPPENAAEQQAQEAQEGQADPADNADPDAQVEALINGDLPDGADVAADGQDLPQIELAADVDAAEMDGMVDAQIVDNGTTISTGKELVVINSSVQDKDAILAELKPNQEVLVLEDGNGLDELQEYLDEHAETKYEAIHFVTHGNEGVISVNGEVINAENVDAAEWAAIGGHLTEDGDILFYGCDTAKTAEGQQLMDAIAEASGADVAASDDATGVSGDWDLEYTVGTVEHEAIAVDGYNYDLDAQTVVVHFQDFTGGQFTDAFVGAGEGTKSDTYTLINSDQTEVQTWSEGYYVVGADYNNDGKIDAADAALGKSTFTISNMVTASGDVKLILADGFTLKVTSTNDNAISADNTLTIYGQTNGTGALNAAVSAQNCIGIKATEVKIYGGSVTAIATGSNGVGIRAQEDITIYGGSVTAIATGDFGYGIHAQNSSGANTAITINLNSSLTVYGKTSGIYCNNGNVSIAQLSGANGTFVVQGGDQAIKAAKIGFTAINGYKGIASDTLKTTGETASETMSLTGQYEPPETTFITIVPEAGITYRNWTGTAFEDKTIAHSDYTLMTSGTTSLTADKPYVSLGYTELTNTVTGTGAVSLILTDSSYLTVAPTTAGATAISAATLTVYGQTNGTGTLTATGGDRTSSDGGAGGAGISATTLTINGGKVYATGGATDTWKYAGGNGIYASGSITINGGTVNATGGKSTFNDLYGTGSKGGDGISSPDNENDAPSSSVTINGGTVNATGGDSDGNKGGNGIYELKSVTIKGGTVNATGGDGISSGGNGIHSEKSSVTITGGTVITTGGKTTSTSNYRSGGNGIYASGSIEVNGGTGTADVTVTATGGTGTFGGNGISAFQSVTITGGTADVTVTATGGTGTSKSGGDGIFSAIYDPDSPASSSITITGGKGTADVTVTATGGTGTSGGNGIYSYITNPKSSASSSIEVTGGTGTADVTVTATGGTGTSGSGGNGIYSYITNPQSSASSSIKVTGGTVTATGGNSESDTGTGGAGISTSTSSSGTGTITTANTTVSVTGGTVNATGGAGGTGGAGISTSISNSGTGTITTANATVSVTGTNTEVTATGGAGTTAGDGISAATVTVSADLTVKAGTASASAPIAHTSETNIASDLSGKRYAKVYAAETKSLTVTTANDVVNDTDGLISLREAIAYAEAGTKDAQGNYTITFADSIFTNNAATISLDTSRGALTINKGYFTTDANKLTITVGDGKTLTLDGGHDNTHDGTQIMTIGVDGTTEGTPIVVLNNLTFTKGYAEKGGAISNAGVLTITNSKFTSNTANMNGGAIYSDAAQNITIKNGVFENNNSAADGGAVYIKNATAVTVTDSVFTGNQTSLESSFYGGAIYASSVSTFTVTGSTFTDNKTTSTGGAISCTSGNSTAITTTIANSTFVGNNIAEHSSAIYNWGNNGTNATLNLVNNVIINNFIGKEGNSTVNSIGVNYVDQAIYAAASQVFDSGIDTLKSTTSSKTFANNALPGKEPTYMKDADGNMLLKYLGDADGKGVYVHKDAAGNIGWSSDGEAITWLSGTTHDSVTEITVKGTGGKPNAGSGATASSSENSLTVNTLYDVFNPHDGLISLREAIVYASNGVTSTAEGHTGEYYIDFDYATLGNTFTIALVKANGALTVNSANFTAENPLTIAAATGKSVTIDGGYDSTVVDSGVQIMSIAAGSNVELTNLTFTKGYATDGGAISNAGTLTITGGSFTNNTATENGGAIYNTGKVTIEGTTSSPVVYTQFTGNTATGNGGAIYNASSASDAVTITGATFGGTETNDGNSAVNGGAIYNTAGTLTIKGGTFTGNQATGTDSYDGGGAIYNNGTLTVTNIDNTETYTTFTGNKATSNGGAIYSEAGTLTISGGSFTGNHASGGGAIYASGTTEVSINKTTFTENEATKSGGAITSGKNCTLEISGASFTGNTATENGGAINNVGKLTISGATFGGDETNDGNSAAKGGAIYCNANGTLTVNNSTFSGNTATENGGAIYNAGTLTVNNSTFAGNTATENGGAIYQSRGTSYILNSTFTNNTAKSGQAIYVDDPNAKGSEMNLVNNIIIGNGSGAGVVKGDKGTITAYGINVVDQTTIDRGVVTVADSSKLNTAAVADIFKDVDGTGKAYILDGSTRFRIIAGESAEGVYVFADATYANIAWSDTATGTKSVVRGTAESATTVINVSSMIDSDGVAYAGYGVLYMDPLVVTTLSDVVNPDDGKISLREAVTYANTNGGEITFNLNATEKALTNSTITLSLGTLAITGTKAITINGTLALAGGDTTVTISGGYDSAVAGSGVQILTVAAAGNVTLTNLTFTKGSAASGGAISNEGTLTVDTVTFTGNTAATGGGAINNAVTGTATIKNSTFSGNTATPASSGAGGAINNGGTMTISDSTFTSNTALVGGAIQNGKTLTVSGSTFTGNTANSHGGAIWNGSTLTVVDSLFTSNTASGAGGGAIYTTGTAAEPVVVVNTTFAGNTAANDNGGAIYSASVKATIVNSTFSNNSAAANDTSGQAIYAVYGTLNLANNIIVGNGTLTKTGEGTEQDPFVFTETYAGVVKDASASVIGYGVNVVDNGSSSTISATDPNVTRIEKIAQVFADVDGETGKAVFDNGAGKFRLLARSTTMEIPGTDGVYTWSNADYTALAWSATAAGTKNAIIGTAKDATTQLNPDYMIVLPTGQTSGGKIIVAGNGFFAMDTVSLKVTTTSDVVNYYDGVTSLREAIQYAMDDAAAAEHDPSLLVDGKYTVTFDSSVFTKESHTITVKQTLVVTKDKFKDNTLVIQGLDLGKDANGNKVQVTIDGGGTYNTAEDTFSGKGVQILKVNAGNTVNVSNMTFTNACSTSGSGIYNLGTMTITDCTFTDNVATSKSNSGGGAIQNGNGSAIARMTIENCYFYNNQATGVTSTTNCCCGGGAVRNDGAWLTITNSTFDLNKVKYACWCTDGGGAVYSLNGWLSISNSTFTRNTTAYEGSAVYIFNNKDNYGGADKDRPVSTAGGKSPMEVSDAELPKRNQAFFDNVTFTNNGGSYSAGAVYIYGKIVSATWVWNKEYESSTDTEMIGHYYYRNLTQFTNCTFNGNFVNSADNHKEGGAISAYNYQRIVVDGCKFYGNVSMNKGGAIAVNNYIELTVTNSTFGGGMLSETGKTSFVNYDKATQTGDTITNGSCTLYYKDGNWYADEDCTKEWNTVVIDRGEKIGTYTLYSLAGFRYYNAADKTYYVATQENGNNTDTAYFTSGNLAMGAIYDSIAKNGTTTGNGNGGGAIAVYYTSNANISNSTFINNVSSNGGAIFTYSCSTNSQTYRNVARANWFSTYTPVGITVDNCTFTGNRANLYEDADKATDPYNQEDTPNYKFGGGAVYSNLARVYVLNSVFTENTANNGGAVYAYVGASLTATKDLVPQVADYYTTIVNSSFIGNSAVAKVNPSGYVNSGTGGAVASYIYMTRNSDARGGNLYLTLNIANSTFTGNTADGTGTTRTFVGGSVTKEGGGNVIHADVDIGGTTGMGEDKSEKTLHLYNTVNLVNNVIVDNGSGEKVIFAEKPIESTSTKTVLAANLIRGYAVNVVDQALADSGVIDYGTDGVNGKNIVATAKEVFCYDEQGNLKFDVNGAPYLLDVSRADSIGVYVFSSTHKSALGTTTEEAIKPENIIYVTDYKTLGWSTDNSTANIQWIAQPGKEGTVPEFYYDKTLNRTEGMFYGTNAGSGATYGTKPADLTVNTTVDELDFNNSTYSLREAIYAAGHGVTDAEGRSVITFDSSVFTEAAHTITLDAALGALAVNELMTADMFSSTPLVIDGNVNVTLDGGNAAQIFSVAANKSVQLNNLTFANGNADNGGAIYNAGTLTVVNSSFTGNGATGNGGAIYNTGTITVVNGSVINSKAAGSGQAVYAESGTVNLVNSIVIGDGTQAGVVKEAAATVSVHGVIVTDAASADAVTPAADSRIITVDDAAAVVCYDEQGNLKLDANGAPYLLDVSRADSVGVYVFSSADSEGKADYQVIGWNTVNSTTGIRWIGGTVPASVCAATLNRNDGLFFGTNAGSGATYGTKPADLTVNTTVDELDFTNSAYSLREAIYAAGHGVTDAEGKSVITFDGSVFTAAAHTIALRSVLSVDEFMINDTFSATPLVISGNVSVRLDGCDTVQIFNVAENKNVVLSGLTFVNGNADNGGAIANAGTLTVVNGSFIVNAATGNGGAIYNTGKATVISSTFETNWAEGDGQAVYAESGTVDLVNSIVVGNGVSAGVAAGSGIISGYGVNVTDAASAERIMFAAGSRSIVAEPEEVFYDDAQGELKFDENGAPYLLDVSRADSEGVYVFSSADRDGKADYQVIGWNTVNSTTGIRWIGGTAPASVCAATLNRTEGLFYGTNAGSGATYGIKPADLTVNTTVDELDFTNSAYSLREAIYAAGHGVTDADGQSVITFDASVFTEAAHTITLQSALPVDEFMTNNMFYGNDPLVIHGNVNVTLDGGNATWIFRIAEHKNVVLSNLTFANGKALYGGAIFNAGTLTVDNSTFTGNRAVYGGAIGNVGMLTVDDSIFTGNTADIGGAICNIGMLAVSNGIFTGNTADIGGVIANDGMLTVSGGIITGNEASGNGGVLYNKSGTANVANYTITGNRAAGAGQAIYAEGGTVNLVNSIIVGKGTQAGVVKTAGAVIRSYGANTVDAASAGNIVRAADGSLLNISDLNTVFKTEGDGKITYQDGLPMIRMSDVTKGVFVWASQDFQNVAWSLTVTGQKHSVAGDISQATVCVNPDFMVKTPDAYAGYGSLFAENGGLNNDQQRDLSQERREAEEKSKEVIVLSDSLFPTQSQEIKADASGITSGSSVAADTGFSGSSIVTEVSRSIAGDMHNVEGFAKGSEISLDTDERSVIYEFPVRTIRAAERIFASLKAVVDEDMQIMDLPDMLKKNGNFKDGYEKLLEDVKIYA